jgi:hypothetical protein
MVPVTYPVRVESWGVTGTWAKTCVENANNQKMLRIKYLNNLKNIFLNGNDGNFINLLKPA